MPFWVMSLLNVIPDPGYPHAFSDKHRIKGTHALSSIASLDLTILLVDDDVVVLALLKVILSREGYRVIAADSPKSAVEIAVNHPFNMLITDFQMPGMNGFELAKRLTKDRVALPVLMISGSDPNEVPLLEISERHWNFMSKPIDRERLLRIIDGECLGWALRMRA